MKSIYNLLGVPKISAPLAKAIRTSEGIMVWAVNVLVAVLSYVEGLSLIPHQAAAWIIAANTAVHVVSRTLLKVVAIQKEVGIESPIPFEETPPNSSVAPEGVTGVTSTTQSGGVTAQNVTLGQP